MLSVIKSSLKITWDNEDKELESIIARGKSRLQGLTGTTLNFEDGEIQDLLINYCRYAYNNALEYFEENFQREILRLQLKEAINDYANQTEQA